jgi:protein-L-isoaspartate(D-aspartate) O-methyltransferase
MPDSGRVAAGTPHASPSQPTPAGDATVTAMTADTMTETPDQRREALVAALQDEGCIRTPEVAAAFRAVAREHFAPGYPLDDVYGMHSAVVTKMGEHGRGTTSISAPWLQARMLEDAQIQPGQRVLEIGSGGCNAAYMSSLTGPAGSVVTVDIDPWVTARAEQFLNEAGYTNVQVVTGDADHAADAYGPFDRVIVTVGVWDAPWARLLTEGGRMVIPVMVATFTRSVTFTRTGDVWTGENPVVCGFVMLQGAGSGWDQQPHIGGGAVHLNVEGGPAVDAGALDRALAGGRTETWTGITIDNTVGTDTLNMHLATEDDRAGNIWASPGCDLVRMAYRWRTPALTEPDSFAYLTSRPIGAPEEYRSELGVHAHGPRAAALAGDLAGHVEEWDRSRRHGPGPEFTLYPAGARIECPPGGRVFRRRHVQIVVAWP